MRFLFHQAFYGEFRVSFDATEIAKKRRVFVSPFGYSCGNAEEKIDSEHHEEEDE